jgi:hypothetical protein
VNDRVTLDDFNSIADMTIGPDSESVTVPSAGRSGQPDNRGEKGTVEPESRPERLPGTTRTPPPALALEPNILDKFGRDVRRAGVAGEQHLAKRIYLCLTSRLLPGGKPTRRPVSTIAKGTSSTGKSHTLRTVLRFFPGSAYLDLGSMSRRYLLYSEEPLAHRFIVIPEYAVIEKDEEIVAALRTLLSEGRLIHGTVSADGKPTAYRIEKEGPIGILMTTTSAAVDPELETRCLADFTDDSPEQTRRVYLVLAGLEDTDEDPVDYEQWHELQEWLADHGERRVLIPYVRALAHLFPDVAARLRRDYVSTLCLTGAHAILHQATRERDSHGRIVATIGDYECVRELVGPLIAEGADAGVSPAIGETVETVKQLLQENRTGHVGMKAIVDALAVGRSAAYDRINRALLHGYLIDLSGKNERGKKIALGGALPGEDLFLPTGDDLVRATSDTPTGHVFRSTIDDTDDTSGRPGRPLVIGDDGYLGLLDRALASGFVSERERRQRRRIHLAIRRAAA